MQQGRQAVPSPRGDSEEGTQGWDTSVPQVGSSPLQTGDVLQLALADLSEVAASDEIDSSGGRKGTEVWRCGDHNLSVTTK